MRQLDRSFVIVHGEYWAIVTAPRLLREQRRSAPADVPFTPPRTIRA